MKAGIPRWPAPVFFAALCLLAACTKRAAPTPGPAPEKVYGSDETAIADGGRGRAHSLEDMGFGPDGETPEFLPPLYFGLGQSTPLPGQISTLRVLVTETPKYRACRIMGHTCPIGETTYNEALGYQRAQVVLGYLRDAGVRTGVHVISYGEEDPVAFTPDEYHLNRRVVVGCVR